MIANAGIPSKAGGLDSSVEDWNRVRAVDFDGAYYCARAAGLVFKAQGHGNCIFTASMSGHAANVPQEQSGYNACKAGVVSCLQLSIIGIVLIKLSDPSLQVLGCRVGKVGRKSQLCFSWIY